MDLPLDGVKTRLRIIGVRGDNLQIELPKGVGWIGSEVTLAQLPLEEKQARLTGKLEPAAMSLWAGLVLLKAIQFDRALEQFKGAGDLAIPLQVKMESVRKILLARALATLPPEEQVRRVLGELRSLNPGFDGRGTHRIENGQVTELALCADSLTDLSPLSGLKTLRRLTCSGSDASKRGLLVSLTPLTSLSLTTLCVSNTQVADLAPLKGMPLTSLNCDGTAIHDLVPLEGLPLQTLGCAHTEVTNLVVLKTLPLQQLNCDAPLAVQYASLLRGLRTLTTINNTPAAERGQPLNRENKTGSANFSIYSAAYILKAPFTPKEQSPKDGAGKELVFTNALEKLFFHFHGPNEGGHRWVIWKDDFQFEQGKRYKFTCFVRAPNGLKENEVLYFALTPTSLKKEQGMRLNLQSLPEKEWVFAQLVFEAEEPDIREIQVTINATPQDVDLCDVRLGPAQPGEESGISAP
ncbi:MAG: hypothetical protein NTY53_26700 [Kiritimatiellaeota bacterium]|nr:hypothetical protein [Kiritimatiellota bacterium]